MSAIIQNFSAEELAVLHEVPFWVFYEVAGADSVIDVKEIEVFQKMLTEAPRLRDQFARDVFTSMKGNFDKALAAASKADPRDSVAGLQKAMDTLARKTTPENCAEFKQLVFVMGWSVAAAAGEPDAVEGEEDSNISAEEIQNLSRIADILGLNMAKLRRVITSNDGEKVWQSFLVS